MNAPFIARKRRSRGIFTDRLAGRFANHVLLDRRQRQDPLRLQRLEHGQAGLDLVVALFGAPVEMLADGAGEVVAAGMRDVLDRPLDVLELPAVHPASREGGHWQLCDVCIHAGAPNRSNAITPMRGSMSSDFFFKISETDKKILLD